MTHEGIKVLDHGFVRLVDKMGDDPAIVQAARVSYGAGTKTVNEDRGLLRYLMRKHHWTPFEMCSVKFHVRAPIFVIRQLFRHRTAKINETSLRYSEMTDDFYMPDVEVIQPQSSDNKQGRNGSLNNTDQKGVQWMIDAAYDHSYQAYKILLGSRVGSDPNYPDQLMYDPYDGESPILSDEFTGVARELARTVLPVGAYSEFYFKIDLRNLLNLINLRIDAHAQYEIRVFAQAMIDICRPLFPLTFEAWEDYIRGAVSLSRMETNLMMDLLHSDNPATTLASKLEVAGSAKAFAESYGMSLREYKEWAERFGM